MGGKAVIHPGSALGFGMPIMLTGTITLSGGLQLDNGNLSVSLTNQGLDLNGLLATQSSEGASSLNTMLGTNAFRTGQPVGGVLVILPAAAS